MNERLKKFYTDKRVLVTGGAGFIGSHLVDTLVEIGAHVTVLDNLSTGSIDNLSESASKITFMLGSITNESLVKKAIHNQQIIFHLAAITSVQESIAHEEKCMKVNVTGTENLLNAAAQEKSLISFVFSSSASVYGEQANACTEEMPLAPQSPYAISKQHGEVLARNHASKTNTSVTCLRYFNVFDDGKKRNKNGVYACFEQKLKTNKPITLYGNGDQTRDFVPVSMVVNANLQAASIMGMKGQAVNVASGQSMTLNALIEMLEEKLETTCTSITNEPSQQGDITHSLGDVTRLNKMLSYPAKK